MTGLYQDMMRVSHQLLSVIKVKKNVGTISDHNVKIASASKIYIH